MALWSEDECRDFESGKFSKDKATQYNKESLFIDGKIHSGTNKYESIYT